MIRFACPSCGAKVAAPEQLAGRKAPCKRCGETIRVPAEPPTTAIAAEWKEPCTEAASAPTPWENLEPEVLPLGKTPRSTQMSVVIGLLASLLVLGLIGAGAGCYYLFFLPYAQRDVPSVPAAALPPTPTIPAAPARPAVDTGAARMEAERKEAERERRDAERQAQEETAVEAKRFHAAYPARITTEGEWVMTAVEAKRFHAAYSLLTKDEQAVADHILHELGDPGGKGLPPNIEGWGEYTMLKRHWGDGLFDTKKGRADVARFAWASGFDKVSAEIGWKPTEAGLSEAALEWFFLRPEFSLKNRNEASPPMIADAAIKQYQQLGYDKMHPLSREFMLDHPALFRPILKARMGRYTLRGNNWLINECLKIER
jgi:hypothetical protein